MTEQNQEQPTQDNSEPLKIEYSGFDDDSKDLKAKQEYIAQALRQIKIPEGLKETLQFFTELRNSEGYKAIQETLRTAAQFLKAANAEREALEALGAAREEAASLAIFLQMELDELSDLAVEESYIDILRKSFDTETGELIENEYTPLIQRARQRRAEYEEAKKTAEEIEQAVEELPRIIANPTDKVDYPEDKPNSVIWNLLTTADKDGQIRFDIDTSRKGSKQDAIVYYGIDFNELETSARITKQLTPFDKRCYIAAAALFNAGNDIITATQVYYMMGNSKSTTPSTTDTQKINDSLTKMGAARVYIDNIKETQTAKGYAHFQYDAALLPFERIKAYINGKLTDSAIHLFREPPLISFARQRNQITTLSRQLLESPVSKTNAHLRIDDYLIERIGHMKNSKGNTPRKMKFTTIYKQCGITTSKQKQRAPETIRRYLDHYKACDWIKGYKEDADGITIQL